MDKQAKCPKCGIKIVWDWDQDCYKSKADNEFLPVKYDKDIAYYSCNCGQSLGNIDDETVHSIPELKDIDWELDCNSFVDANFNHKAAFVGTPFMATIEYKYYKDEIESLFE